jgi:hypothetical protein
MSALSVTYSLPLEPSISESPIAKPCTTHYAELVSFFSDLTIYAPEMRLALNAIFLFPGRFSILIFPRKCYRQNSVCIPCVPYLKHM